MAKNLMSKVNRRRFTDQADGFASVLGPETLIEGTFRGAGGVEIEGTVKGELAEDGLVWILARGSVDGEIKAESVVVEGGM